MLVDSVRADFEQPPSELAFELRYADLLSEVQRLAQRCLDTEPEEAAHQRAATQLYVMTQAIPSVLLNYKICIDFGLPLHPTQYIDFVGYEKNPEAYLPSTRQAANELFQESVDVAREVYRLGPICTLRLAGLRARIPEFLTGFLYTNTPDKYTWRASDPESVKRVAAQVRASGFQPDLILGAAHGSIRPGLLLANLLGCQLYFSRFSMFKRDDERPIESAADLAWLARFQRKRVLVFDEDVAKGRTLRAFAETFRGRFAELRTAAVLRHYLAPFKPDYVGREFYDE